MISITVARDKTSSNQMKCKLEKRYLKPWSMMKEVSAHTKIWGEASPWTGISNICLLRYMGQSSSCGLNMSHSIFRELMMRDVGYVEHEADSDWER